MILTLRVSRFTKMEKGQCIIGMKREAMIPLISFDALVNVGTFPIPQHSVSDQQLTMFKIYLTFLFIIPLSGKLESQTQLCPLLP
jgi:hypothetical protein